MNPLWKIAGNAFASVQLNLKLRNPERCILTTIDLETAEFRSTERTVAHLSEFRADEQGRVFLRSNLIAKNEGIIQVGDPIEVLEYKRKEFYADKAEQSTADNPFVAVTSVGRKH